MNILLVSLVIAILMIPFDFQPLNLIIPNSQTASAQGNTAAADCESPYLVSPGESLSMIAYRCKISQADLLRANPNIVNPHLIYAGYRLILPDRDAVAQASTQQSSAAQAQAAQPEAQIPVTGSSIYTVKRGDTLGRIAGSTSTTVSQLMWANPSILDPNRIFPGQQLTIPAPGSMPRELDWRADRIARSIERQQSNGVRYSPKSANERWIHVDLSTQTVHAYEGNQIVRSFIVSTGKSSTPTVTGTYPIWIKLRYDDMRGPGYHLRDVSYVMYFYRGYGLPGTYWHNNFGTPMSAGCVNLTIDEAGWLYEFASVGTIVNVE
jgi:lipoprotein-anchoring transpeptidase ErfK/SrfK